jgi:hypothetical protein
VSGVDGADPDRVTRRAARLEALPMCVLGALLLVCALDPARWPDYLSPQWFFGAAALIAGFWAGAPIVDRPAMASFRLKHQLQRHRNTLLVAVSALLAALQDPPTWLMAVAGATAGPAVAPGGLRVRRVGPGAAGRARTGDRRLVGTDRGRARCARHARAAVRRAAAASSGGVPAARRGRRHGLAAALRYLERSPSA